MSEATFPGGALRLNVRLAAQISEKARADAYDKPSDPLRPRSSSDRCVSAGRSGIY